MFSSPKGTMAVSYGKKCEEFKNESLTCVDVRLPSQNQLQGGVPSNICADIA